MRIVLGLIACLLVAAATATARSANASARVRSASATATATAPRAELTGASCVRSAQPFYRSFTLTAVMRPVPGTRSMQTDFELLERTPLTAGFTAVHGPNLWRWLGPGNPTLGERANDVWNDQHSVSDLAAPARYRFVVLFRWRGLHGRIIRRATRTSAVCVERDRRPEPTTTTTTTSTTTTSTTSNTTTSTTSTTTTSTTSNTAASTPGTATPTAMSPASGPATRAATALS